MKSNHARLISSALVVLAGTVLVSSPNSTNHGAGVFFVLFGGIALALEWFASFFAPGFWNEKYVVPLPEKPSGDSERINSVRTRVPS